MSRHLTNGRFADEDEVILAASAARTVSGAGPTFDTDCGVARLTLAVTATAGNSETLDVAIQTRKTATDSWVTVASFTQATDVTTERKVFTGLDRLVQAAWTIDQTLQLSAVTAGGEAGILSASGTPADAERASFYRVEIDAAGTGAVGSSTFRWSKDNGATWVASGVATSNSILLTGTGITLNFPDTGMTTAHFWTFAPTGQASFTFGVSGELV